MRKSLMIFCCVFALLAAGPCVFAQDKGKEGKGDGQHVNKEIKETSKEVAKESKKIFRKTGKAGKSFWRGLKEGFKETK